MATSASVGTAAPVTTCTPALARGRSRNAKQRANQGNCGNPEWFHGDSTLSIRRVCDYNTARIRAKRPSGAAVLAATDVVLSRVKDGL